MLGTLRLFCLLSRTAILTLSLNLSNYFFYTCIHVTKTTYIDLSAQLLNAESTITNENNSEEPTDPTLGSFLNPVSSCKQIPQDSLSGHYWIQINETGYANLEYCDMTRTCCNSTGGWMRVAYLNFTDVNQSCPLDFRLITSPKRTCGTPGSSCVSTTFPLNGIKYSRVCGKIKAYQLGSPNAFEPYFLNKDYTIDSGYVEGVSLTHGQTPKKHIWTFAAALDETRSDISACPCTKTDTSYTGAVPPFIGQDYFCDTGSRYLFQFHQFYHADPLWDGSGCGSTSSCCGFNNPPWFCKQLPQPTSDDIEMRACVHGETNNEDIAIQIVEIFVQ